MRDKVLDQIKSYNMLMQGDHVVVGLSGGADSVALLCVLHELSKELGITLSACHVNHCLRGAESDGDERFCRELCREKGISFTAKKVDVTGYCSVNHTSTEEGARILRYEALLGCDENAKVATAHTRSDNAETVLLNLARGSALDGLCGIPPVRGRIIRPILGCTRAEVEDYLKTLSQNFVTDSTNLSDDYSRNRVRHLVIPVLKELNPAFEASVARACAALGDDRRLLGDMAKETLLRAKIDSIAPKLTKRFERLLTPTAECSRDIISAAPRALRMRCYRAWLDDFSQRCDYARLNKIDGLISETADGVLPLDNKTFLSCRGDVIRLEQKPVLQPVTMRELSLSEAENGFKLPLGGNFSLTGRRLDEKEIKFFVNNRQIQFKNAIDCDRINNIITLRQRVDGDRIALFGRGCTQTFKNLLNSAKILPEIRDALAVLSDSEGAFWLEGFGVSNRAAISSDTQRAILLDIQED